MLTEKQKKRIAVACVLLFVLASVAVCWFVGRPLLQFVSEPERFREWVDEKGVLGRLAFVGMMVLQIFIAVIPGEPLEIGAGYAFGTLEGMLLCLLGAVIGSALVFGFVRRFGLRAVELFFPREKIFSLSLFKGSGASEPLGVYCIFYSRHAKGYPVVLHRSDAHAVFHLAGHFRRSENSIRHYLHHWGRRAWGGRTRAGGAGIRHNAGHQRRGGHCV